MFIIAIMLNLLLQASPSLAETEASPQGDEERQRALELVKNDPLRPIFHAVSPVFIMGDPNGLIEHKGVYHLFFQHTLTFASNPRMHWGHMRSKDLLHWELLPIALYPDKYYHIASGSAVNNNGVVTAIFTGAEPQQQCLAFSKDEDLINWEQYDKNPVVAGPPEGMKVPGFRDPYVWKEQDHWMMGVGSGIEGIGGTVLLYRSPDLKEWKYAGPLYTGDRKTTWEMYECPSFFSLGDKHVLTCNALPLPVDHPRFKTIYYVGKYENSQLIPECSGELDLFGEIWAPQVFIDSQDRRILLAFAWEARNAADHGWSGSMTLPRQLTLGSNGKLEVAPLKEVETLRQNHQSFAPMLISPTDTHRLGDTQGDSVEIGVEIVTGKGALTAERCGVVVRRSPGGEEQTRIVIDRQASRIYVDRTKASLDPKVYGGSRTDRGFIDLEHQDSLQLRIFVDKSVLDVFVNQEVAGTTRIYPTRNDSLGIDLFTEGGTMKVRSVDVWQMKP